LWIFIPFVILEIIFYLWGVYKDILDRWCKGLKKERVTLRLTTTRHIDIGARGAVSRVYAHIYTAIYRTANHPYTRVSDPGSPRITGSQGHGVTRATEPQSHRVTETQGHRITKYPSIQESWGHRVTRATLSYGYWVIGSLGHWVTGLSVTRVYLHGSGLHDYPGSRVT
jgi:hypothetical protein